jgi:hypothetical protein
MFLSFSKIPSLLKSEFGCESYRIFCEDIFCRFRTRFGPEIQPKINRKASELFSCIFGFGPVGPSFGPGSPEKVGNDPNGHIWLSI